MSMWTICFLFPQEPQNVKRSMPTFCTGQCNMAAMHVPVVALRSVFSYFFRRGMYIYWYTNKRLLANECENACKYLRFPC